MPRIDRLLSLCLLLTITVTESKVGVELKEEIIPKEIPGKKTDVEWELKLSCIVTSEDDAEVSVKWEKDDAEIELKERVSFSNDGNVYNITIKSATSEDSGRYDCVVKSNEQQLKISSNLLGISVPRSLKITEGDQLQINCLTFGGPAEISWKIDNSEVPTDDERIRLLADEHGTHNAILLIDSVALNDTAKYTCIGRIGQTIVEKTSNVTVIDPNAALFPFLCICAEVAVLCAIIFIFEKRYKKRAGIGSEAKK